MAEPYARTAKRQKSGTDAAIGIDRACHQWFAPVLADLRALFPKKTALHISSRAGRSVRVCEIWLSEKGAPDGRALAALIRSDVGDRVLAALTADCRHPWAENFRATQEISKLRKQQADAARRLEALERGLK